MKTIYTAVMTILAAIVLVGSIGAGLQPTAFAVGDPNIDETAKGHGDEVSRQAVDDPNIVPGTATGHGDEVSDAARAPR